MNLARLNHVLIPSTKTGRDRFRTGRLALLVRPLAWGYRALSVEGRFLAVFSIIAGASGLEVRANQIHLLWCGIIGLLVGSLLFRRPFALSDVEVQVDHPDRVGVGEPLRVALTLKNRGSRAHRAIRVDGPLLPWDGRYLGSPPTLPELSPGRSGRLELELAFSQRGEHHLDPFHAAALVPIGLALGPGLHTKGIRFLVLPKVAPIARFDTPAATRYQPGGVALASRTGEAREIVGLRPYRPGDPVRDLCHRAWARLGVPVVREYQQEYFTRFGVVIDTEAPGAGDRRLEAGISLAAGVLAHLSRGEALIDLMIVGSDLHRLTLGRSLGFLEQGLDLLSVVQPSGAFDGDAVTALLGPHLDRLSSVVFVALRWDDRRRAVVEHVKKRGVGCRVLLVGGADDPNVSSVPLEALEAGEALLL